MTFDLAGTHCNRITGPPRPFNLCAISHVSLITLCPLCLPGWPRAYRAVVLSLTMTVGSASFLKSLREALQVVPYVFNMCHRLVYRNELGVVCCDSIASTNSQALLVLDPVLISLDVKVDPHSNVAFSV